jgi:hypothetical protein
MRRLTERISPYRMGMQITQSDCAIKYKNSVDALQIMPCIVTTDANLYLLAVLHNPMRFRGLF